MSKYMFKSKMGFVLKWLRVILYFLNATFFTVVSSIQCFHCNCKPKFGQEKDCS